MIYQSISLFESVIETDESGITQMSFCEGKLRIVKIPYAKVTGIYRRGEACTIESRQGGKALSIDLTIFNYARILKDILPRVDASAVSEEILKLVEEVPPRQDDKTAFEASVDLNSAG